MDDVPLANTVDGGDASPPPPIAVKPANTPRIRSCVRVRVCVRVCGYALFGLALIYASALAFIPLGIANQILATDLPGPDSPFWSVLFPLQTALNPASVRTPVHTRDLTALPWFAAAAPFFLACVLIEYAIIRFTMPEKRYHVNDALGSLACGLLSRVGGVAFTVALGPAYTAIWDRARVCECDVNTVFGWYVGLVLVDLGYYWVHRASHVVSAFWASHSVHHQAECYNLTTALRQPLLDAVGTFVFYLPAAFFVPLPLAQAHLTFNLLWQFWIHTELIGRLGPLEWVFNTASHHRVHHSRRPEHIDKNFASIFIVWDRLFGTFYDETWGGEPLRYGVIPPLQSFSPVWASVVELKGILDRMIAAPGIWNKLSMIYRGPGWRYSVREQRCKFFAVPAIGHRMNPNEVFDPEGPERGVTAYVAVHFLVLVAVYFMCGDLWDDPARALVAAITFGFSLHTLTAFVSGDPWAPYLEVVRLPLMAAAYAGAVYNKHLPEDDVLTTPVFQALVLCVSGISVIIMCVLLVLRRRQPRWRRAAMHKLASTVDAVAKYIECLPRVYAQLSQWGAAMRSDADGAEIASLLGDAAKDEPIANSGMHPQLIAQQAAGTETKVPTASMEEVAKET